LILLFFLAVNRTSADVTKFLEISKEQGAGCMPDTASAFTNVSAPRISSKRFNQFADQPANRAYSCDDKDNEAKRYLPWWTIIVRCISLVPSLIIGLPYVWLCHPVFSPSLSICASQ
jgi:hypothetical protein